MPKLLQINVTANWGSTGKIAEQLGECVQKNGWESYIAYGRYANPSTSHLIKIGNRLDTYLHFAEQSLFDNEGLCSRKPTRELILQIKNIQPDIVHLHNIHDHYLNYHILFNYFNHTNIKIVWTFHDFWAITGHCMHFVTKDCNRYETKCYDCPMNKVYPKSLLERSQRNYLLKKELFSTCKNLTIVPVSEWVGAMTRKSFLANSPIKVIPNGIDTDLFKPTTLDLYHNDEVKKRIENKFVILSVASQWEYDKGLDDYIRISKILKDDEVIVLVGVSNNIKKKLPNNIIGINRTNNVQELAALYTRADVVAILSSAETFGLTAVEGFACGTPAVVYNNTAPPSLITPATGIVVPNKDYQAVYSAIQELKLHPLNSYDIIKYATYNFDKEKCCNKYLQLYESLI